MLDDELPIDVVVEDLYVVDEDDEDQYVDELDDLYVVVDDEFPIDVVVVVFEESKGFLLHADAINNNSNNNITLNIPLKYFNTFSPLFISTKLS